MDGRFPRVAREGPVAVLQVQRYVRSHPIRSEPDRLSPHRRRPHGAVQLAVRPPARRTVHPAHRRHRPGNGTSMEALQPILDGFRWLGIDWDEGPEVGGPMRAVLPVPCGPWLYATRRRCRRPAGHRGFAYRDYATAEETHRPSEAAQAREAALHLQPRWMAETDAAAGALRGRGPPRRRPPQDAARRRLRASTTWCAARVAFDWALEQDHVIQRADGSPLYHLASAVDDHDFDISARHPRRGAPVEHAAADLHHTTVARLRGCRRYAHLPYVAAPGGKRKAEQAQARQVPEADPTSRRLYDHGRKIMAEAIGEWRSGPERFNPVLVEFLPRRSASCPGGAGQLPAAARLVARRPDRGFHTRRR